MKPLTCPRCQQLYSANFNDHGGQQVRHPMLLRCGHTFCLVCVRKLQHKENLTCPACQMSTEVAQGRLYKSVNPDMFIVGRMWNRRMNLELQSQKISEKFNPRMKRTAPRRGSEDRENGSGVSCSECLINLASCQCYKCDAVMCMPCFNKIHKSSLTLQKHKPVGLTAAATADSKSNQRVIVPQRSRSRYCPSHEQCLIEYYCDDDQLPICSRCVIMGEHRGHSVQTMEDKNKVLLAEMEPAVKGAQETLWRLGKAEKLLRENMPQAQVNTDLLVSVSQHFTALHSVMQAREEQLLDKIRAAANSGTTSFQEISNHIEQDKLNLELALMDAARAKHSSVYGLVDADLILDRLNKARDLPCVVSIQKDAVNAPVKFSVDKSLKETIQQYGSISVANSLQLISLSVAGEDAEKPPVGELRSYTVADVDQDSQCNTDSTSVSLCGSVLLEGCHVALLGAAENKGPGESDSGEDLPAAAQMIEAKSVALPALKPLVVGSHDQVSVTHICTPAQFFVQLVGQLAEIEEMHRQINFHCRNNRRFKAALDNLETGTLVLAQYPADKSWYRGRVKRVIQPDRKRGGQPRLEIYFVDYGNTTVVPRQKLRKMTKRFSDKPVYAIECGLYDIVPADENTGWTVESAQTMLAMTQEGPMQMVVVKVVGGRLEVDLGKVDSDELGPVSVRDSLVFLQQAIFNTRSSHDSGVCFSPVLGPTRRKYMPAVRMSEGSVINIGINCTLTPTLFYAQMYAEESHSHLQQLLVSMQNMYSQQTKHLYRIFCPIVGMICVARYAKDNHWYRATVTGLPGKGKVLVQFVDYGNTEVVDHTDICKILDDHIRFPMQALEMSLSDVEPLEGGQWSEKANKWFRSVVELQLCQLRVTLRGAKPNTLEGVLYAVNSASSTLCCVNYELVKRGYARSTGQWSSEESFEGITLHPDLMISPPPSQSPSPVIGGYRVGSPTHTITPSATSTTTTPAWPKGPNPFDDNDESDDSGDDASFNAVLPKKRVTEHRKTLQQQPARATKRRVSPPLPAMFLNVKEEEDDDGLGVGESRKLEEHALEVVVSCYHSPTHLYIQQHSKQTHLHSLMREMQSYEQAPPCSRRWTVGEFCAALYGQIQNWYRARVEAVQDDGLYQIRLVDYGHTDTISGDKMKPLKSAHGKLECFMERCHITDLTPTGTMDRTKWSQTAIEFISRTIRVAPACYILLKGDRVSDMGLPVDIVVKQTTPPTALEPPIHKYISLYAKLQDEGLAIPVKREETSEQDSSTPVVVEMFQTKLTPTFHASPTPGGKEGEVKEEVKGVDSSLRVCPHPPPSSTQLRVIPVHVDERGVIYAQNVAEATDCQILMETLQSYGQQLECASGETTTTSTVELTPGQPCVAYCSTYGLWLRACVLKVDPAGVQVKYMDYGNMDLLPLAQVKTIIPELCAKHQLVLEMRLQGVNAGGEDGAWPEEYNKFLNNQVINNPFTAVVQGGVEDRPLVVDLIDDQNGSSISKALMVMEQEMDQLYARSNHIADILKLSNPYSTLKLGSKGHAFHAVVSHQELPNVVFLQPCENLSPNHHWSSKQLQETRQTLSELNSLPPQTPAFDQLPPAGTACVGCFREDDCWYRALVVKAWPQERTVLVLYVDYGNCDVLPLDRLRVLPPRFKQLEMQSVRALLNLTLPEGARRWTLDTCRAMLDTVCNVKHRVVIKETLPLTVELYDCEETTRLSYAPLIKKGLVALPQPDETPSVESTAVESSDDEGSTTSTCPDQDESESQPDPEPRVKPEHEPKPTEPMELKPIEPVETQPIEPVEPKPNEPVETQPIEPVEPKLIEPLEPKLIEPVEPQPIEPLEPKPIEPLEPKPIEPVEPKLIEPVEPQPIEPLEPKLIEPVEPQPIEPVEPKPIEAVEPQPIEAEPIEPIEPTPSSQIGE